MQDTAGEARMNSSVMYSYGPPHMAKQKQDDQLEHTHSSYVRIWDVALKTCQKWWMIGRSGERGSGISVLTAQHDDDDKTLFNEEMASSWLKCKNSVLWTLSKHLEEKVPYQAAECCFEQILEVAPHKTAAI